MSSRTMQYPSTYTGVPNVTSAATLPPTSSHMTTANANSANTVSSVGATSAPVRTVGNPMGSSHPPPVQIPPQSQAQAPSQQIQQTQASQPMNSANAATNRQMPSTSVPSIPQLPQLPQQQSPTNSRGAPSYPVQPPTNPLSQSGAHRNPNSQSMHMMNSGEAHAQNG